MSRIRKNVAASCDLLLVVPPFGAPYFPFPGVSLLAAGARERGISTEVYYANLDFAAMVGAQVYEHVAYSYDALLNSEAVFAQAAFPDLEDPASHLRFGGELSIRLEPRIWSQIAESDYRACVGVRETFLERAAARILIREPRIVGLSAMFGQNLAALALAERIKRACPKVLVVMGGAGVFPPMGSALAKISRSIDCIFEGEADTAFPEFCREYLDGTLESPPATIRCALAQNLDSLPVPDFDDYFEQVKAHQAERTLPSDYPYTLYFESSRGCWWGAVHHCRFCGMNADGMAYRSKSPERVAMEIQTLARRYDAASLTATDCIMPREFPETVCPTLVNSGVDVSLQYEVKADLQPAHLDWLKRAHVNLIQPGIESLSSDVLGLMRKGVDAIQNLQLLRNAVSLSIVVRWHLLFGVPQERSVSYRAIIDLLPMIAHLQPPVYLAQIRLDRFSPYFEDPLSYGITNVRVDPTWRHLYPPGTTVEDLIYRFQSDWRTELLDDKILLQELGEEVALWRTLWSNGEPPQLVSVTLPNGRVVIHDTRPVAREPACILEEEAGRTLAELEGRVRTRLAQTRYRSSVLEELLDRGLVVEYEGHLLSLVTDPSLSNRLQNDTFSDQNDELRLTPRLSENKEIAQADARVDS